MSDLKTSLRELSVAVKIGILKNKSEVSNDELLNPRKFFEQIESLVDSDVSSVIVIKSLREFTEEEKQILFNGFELGTVIFNKFNFKKSDVISWVGNDTQKGDPVDLYVSTYGFSLKEDSFILENMGLYKYLSLMTANEYPRSLHIFNEFAKEYYDAWFLYSWQKLLKNPNWTYKSDKYYSKIIDSGVNITFNYNGTEISHIPKSIKTNEDYMNYTSSLTREKVFSKWIKENLEKDAEYISLKKRCSEIAGKTVCDLIKANNNSAGLMRLLQIRDNSYYYAKISDSKVSLMYVPSSKEFKEIISVSSVDYIVPSSQLNIITTIHNTKNNNDLKLRNECRFSHGQFNGTPEAKMYFDKQTNLSSIYVNLIK